jgi:hypothetical protein
MSRAYFATGASTVLLLSAGFGALVDVLAVVRGFFALRARGFASAVAGADDFAATGLASVATGLAPSAAFCFTLANAGADKAKIETRTADKIVRMVVLLAGEQRRARPAYRFVRRAEDLAARVPRVVSRQARVVAGRFFARPCAPEAEQWIRRERVRRSC